MNERQNSYDIKKLVYLAVLTALVFVLQIVANISGAVLATPITLTLVPIVIGTALVGKFSGVWLGSVFGMATLITGAAEPFFTVNPLGTVVTVMVKGMLAGLVAGLIYSLFKDKNKYVAILAAAFAAPIVNTGVFAVGCYLFFYDFVASLAGGTNIFPFIVTGFAGINFLIELLVNIVLAPTILRLIIIRRD